MEKQIVNLAFDYGASSGRLIMSKFNGEKIELEEIHRFSNDPVTLKGTFYWDFLRLFHEMKTGLKKAANKNLKISSIGIDTWGVDYGLLDEKDNLLANPTHYRDARTDNSLKEMEQKGVSFKEIYDITGIQYMALNTLYQLHAEKRDRAHILDKAKTLLFMPDLFTFFLTGEKHTEYTIASTAQMLDAKSRDWAMDLLKKLELPVELLKDIIMPGTIAGYLTEEIQREVQLPAVPVVAVGSHDTASAVAGTPLFSKNSAYLSCGTWSLLGIEADEPIINEKSLQYNFTNEGGVENKIRFLKNINGLWIIQNLRKNWSEKVAPVGFPDIIEAAKNAKNKHFIIEPNDSRFTAPLNMAEAIIEYCREKGQGTPEGLGEIAMAVYNGLTQEYKTNVENLEKITGKTIDVINMVGGGIQDEFLCQLTANSTGKKVLAGPIEASVLGNVVMQLMALGEIKSLEEGRRIISNSFEVKEFNSK
ncbi:rhamnulokinase [Clostridium sp. SYSU_GA19001]|uniref:rhamnulokinase n=1 Tax=Clostridium caldaquaticum TaxID=2940653 RepID=UPI002076E1F2|nr:rhamnulokinase family protein [Clostridium caldaquaticum]MCM8710017.1 rhamnulokinase [Clostridium caldaquaticum]